MKEVSNCDLLQAIRSAQFILRIYFRTHVTRQVFLPAEDNFVALKLGLERPFQLLCAHFIDLATTHSKNNGMRNVCANTLTVLITLTA